MTSTNLMLFLVAFYVLVAAVSAYERNWARVLYWISAATLTISVLWGTK